MSKWNIMLPWCILTVVFYPQGRESLSDYAISFHYVRGNMMEAMDFLIYTLKVHDNNVLSTWRPAMSVMRFVVKVHSDWDEK